MLRLLLLAALLLLPSPPAKAVAVSDLPEELRGLFLEALALPNSPLPYGIDAQGVVSDASAVPPRPLEETQVRDLIHRLEGLWLATRGLPPALTKKRGDQVAVHLYEPDGRATMTGHDLYARMSMNRDILGGLSLEGLKDAIQDCADERGPRRLDALSSLNAFFDKARIESASAPSPAVPGDASAVPLSQTPPARLRQLKAAAENPAARRAIDQLSGQAGTPMIPEDIPALLQESRRLGVAQGADWRQTVEAAILALPMGAEILSSGIDTVWELGRTGRGVMIAHFDSGFPDTSHPLLKGVSNQYVADQPRQPEGHPTMTIGVLRTLAPNAEILAYGVVPPDSVQAVEDGVYDQTGNRALANQAGSSLWRHFTAGLMEDAYRKGARVFSVAVGMRAAENPLQDPIVLKIDELARKGVVVVVAAGNKDGSFFNSAAAKTGSSYTAAPSAITVGYLDAESRPSPSSYSGEIYAPGTRFYLATPPSGEALSALAEGRRPLLEEIYAPASGTSASAPFVAGAVALIREAAPAATPEQIRRALNSAADRGFQKLSVSTALPPLGEIVRLEEQLEWKSLSPLKALRQLESSEDDAAASPRVRVEGEPQDTALVAPVLEALYPTLSEEDRSLVDAGLVFVLSQAPGAVEAGRIGADGWSAEDDPDYRYPDRGLYPQGTIKVTLTPFVTRTAQLLSRLDDPQARRPLWVHLGKVMTHEIAHARQFMTRPLDYHPPCAPGAGCDEARLKTAMLKIQYELEAFEKDHVYEKKHGQDSKALREHLANHPEAAAGLPPQYLSVLLDVKLAPRSATLKPYQVPFYWGGYDPALLSRRYAARLDELEKAGGRENPAAAATRQALHDLNLQYEALAEGASQYGGELAKLWPDLPALLPALRAQHQESLNRLRR